MAMKAFFFVLVIALALVAPAEQKKVLMPYEEEWSKACVPFVEATPRLGKGYSTPTELETPEPITDFKKWGLKCTDFWQVYELVLNEKGEVRCVRILSVTKNQPPKGLYDAVRTQLLRWRFRPSTKDGKPVPVIFNFTRQYKCS
ncbi:MAG: hypothetical protein WC538_07475 [Thermoanaerobaculia bacterium]